MSENYFGVCKCDLQAYEPVVESLVIFETYEEAASYYEQHFKINSRFFDENLYIVFIDRASNNIIQFEKYIVETKCNIIPLSQIKDIKNGDIKE